MGGKDTCTLRFWKRDQSVQIKKFLMMDDLINTSKKIIYIYI
jgi:hypothetical protein